MPYYGPDYSKEEVYKVLEKYKNKLIFFECSEKEAVKRIAREVTSGKIGAIFKGKMEYGPRALGNRSILADVREKNIHERMNLQIKKRPKFQPFCPSILAEEKDRLFEKAYYNLHMTCAFQLKKEYMKIIPGAAHIDGSSRVQFVTETSNKFFYNVLKEIKRLIGIGAVINTSFNKHGRTIVNTPEDAVIDFLDTNLDFLYIEGYWVERR